MRDCQPGQAVGVTKRRDRIVQQLVHDPPGKLLKLRPLLFREIRQLAERSRQLFLRERMVSRVKRIDRWPKLTRSLRTDEFLNVLDDDSPRLLDSPRAMSLRLRNHRL